MGLRLLESLGEEIRRARLVRRHYTGQGQLHDKCFYNELCEPLEDTEKRIRRTSRYIDDAQRLAEEETP